MIFTMLAFLVLGGILYYYSQIESSDRLMRLSIGLYLGGVLGNLIDRLAMGKVTDFISVGNFYIFNVADAAINVGIVVLLTAFWLNERRKAGTTSETEVLSTSGEAS